MNWACFALKNCEEFEKGLDKAQELSGSFAVQFEGGGGYGNNTGQNHKTLTIFCWGFMNLVVASRYVSTMASRQSVV